MPSETDALFRVAYGQSLEADVLDELAVKTDGWAASLSLVRTAMRDRTSSEVRTFVHQLSGAQSELHDYLAEEVVGELPTDHQLFLMRTSILSVVDPEAALRPLIDFLGLEWRPELLDHRSTAKARGAIITPSYDQVVQPLSKAPSGRWRRYEKQLGPVLPVLLPWAERLGYTN